MIQQFYTGLSAHHVSVLLIPVTCFAPPAFSRFLLLFPQHLLPTFLNFALGNYLWLLVSLPVSSTLLWLLQGCGPSPFNLRITSALLMWQVLDKYFLNKWMNHLLKPFTTIKDDDYKKYVTMWIHYKVKFQGHCIWNYLKVMSHEKRKMQNSMCSRLPFCKKKKEKEKACWQRRLEDLYIHIFPC